MWTDSDPAPGSFRAQVDASPTQPLQPWQTGGCLVAAAVYPGALAHFLWDIPEVVARPGRGTEAALSAPAGPRQAGENALLQAAVLTGHARPFEGPRGELDPSCDRL